MAKIIGNTTATPNPQPNWGQTDERKADYIKNKPYLEDVLRYSAQELTEEQQAQVRANIGAGESGFSGNYEDLVNKPVVPAVVQTGGTSETDVMSQKAVTDSLNALDARIIGADYVSGLLAEEADARLAADIELGGRIAKIEADFMYAAQDINTVSGNVTTLIGDDAGKSARAIATEVVEARGESNVYDTAVPVEATALDGAGWYYISININNNEYNFGQIYWDGVSAMEIDGSGGYTMSLSAGYPIVYKDGSTYYGSYTLHVAKLS